MIAHISGRLDRSFENACIVLCSDGLGYELALPAHTLASLPAPGQQVGFYTSLAVREDALELFGFATFAERQCFEILVSISRVGARTALAILSQYRPDDLFRIVQEEDIGALSRVSGIGKKTAQHIFLELKYKLKGAPGMDAPPAGPLSGGPSPIVFRDAMDGLTNLGYAEDEASRVLRGLMDDEPDLDVSGCLRKALRILGRGQGS